MENLQEITIDGSALAAARGEMSIAEAARRLGITRQRLWNWENDIKAIPADYLARVCLLYDKPIEFFTKKFV
jgi:transcriptional regulator with XRE-family HTH domain